MTGEQFGPELERFGQQISGLRAQLVIAGRTVCEIPTAGGRVNFPGYYVEEGVEPANAEFRVVLRDGTVAMTSLVRATRIEVHPEGPSQVVRNGNSSLYSFRVSAGGHSLGRLDVEFPLARDPKWVRASPETLEAATLERAREHVEANGFEESATPVRIAMS